MGYPMLVKAREGFHHVLLFEDACIESDKLFILSSTLGDYKVNIIIVLSLSPVMSVDCVYTLPGIIYNAFCVSDKYIYAFNSKDCQIEKIIRDDI